MTTTFIYFNLACSMLATMFTADVNLYVPMICIAWMGVSAYFAHRAGLLDEE